jgi:Putative addiction module component
MSLPVEVLAREVLRLSTEERAKLLGQVIENLDSDAARDQRWTDLAARRDAEADADPSALVPAHETLARIRADFA